MKKLIDFCDKLPIFGILLIIILSILWLFGFYYCNKCGRLHNRIFKEQYSSGLDDLFFEGECAD